MFFYILNAYWRRYRVMVIRGDLCCFFLAAALTPGDPARDPGVTAGKPLRSLNASATVWAERPRCWCQFGTWMGRIAAGDLGTGRCFRIPLSRDDRRPSGPTLNIALMTIVISVALGRAYGVV